jgi:hypothetical protein
VLSFDLKTITKCVDFPVLYNTRKGGEVAAAGNDHTTSPNWVAMTHYN